MRWLGMTFGDPDITWQSVRLVLPVSVAYDVLLCPFVLYAVVRFGGYSGWASAYWRQPGSLAGRDLARRRAARRRGGGQRSRRPEPSADTRSGREPRLRPAADRQADGWIGGHPARAGAAGQAPGQPPPPAAAAGPRRRRWFRGRQPRPVSRPGPRPARPVHLRLGAPRRGDGCWAGRCAPCSAWAWPARPAPGVVTADGPRLPWRGAGRPGRSGDGTSRGLAGCRPPGSPAPAAGHASSAAGPRP